MAPKGNAKGKNAESGAPRNMQLQNAFNSGIHDFSENGDSGIYVSYPFPFVDDKPQTVLKGPTQTTIITVHNNSNSSAKLVTVQITSSRPKRSFTLSSTGPPTLSQNGIIVNSAQDCCRFPGVSGVIESGKQLPIWLSCTPKEIGQHRTSIVFEFQNLRIDRSALLLVEDEVAQQLAPKQPYSKPHRRRARNFTEYVIGVPPPLPVPASASRKKLFQFPIPDHLRNCVEMNEIPGILEKGLSPKTYINYFSTLLHLEEIQMEEDIREYDMQKVTMRSSGGFLALKVPGLAEKRPSLLYRDVVYVSTSNNQSKVYEGYIYRVEAEEIFLKFDNAVHRKHVSNLLYDVSFSFNRLNMRRSHQAVKATGGLSQRSFLFPSMRNLPGESAPEIKPINRRLNAEQLTAVRQILKCFPGSPPYVIYGPPGTGKTVTVVEAILQIHRMNSNARILACAPSNGASDILLQRLIGPVQQRQMFRLNASSRPYNEVPTPMLPYCFHENQVFSCPSVEELMRYNVIVSTYMSAALLHANGIQAGHFTHIFLDEAGQGSEPESMIPIAQLANAKTVVVLAGDPQQLGPVIRSPLALKFGLGTSYLERLFKYPLYSPGKKKSSFVTKLVRNYRSHPAILEIPSRLFYDGELIACAPEESCSSLCGWQELPNKQFPVLFIGIEGCDEREGASPSWFNRIEASKVVEIIKKLRDYRRGAVTGNDIGVITPYRQQANKLKKALGAMDVKVGSVEQFQGEEKRVIILSTVRSSAKYEEFDEKYNLGFLRNPKRFNVAITRAKSLLVVVGNPHVISQVL
eukprot:Gb_16361 [translate_table: standard]